MTLDPRMLGVLAPAALAVVLGASPAMAQDALRAFDLPAQPMRRAIPSFARQSGLQIVAAEADVGHARASAVRGRMTARAALELMLSGTGLSVRTDDGRTITLIRRAPPQRGRPPPRSPVAAPDTTVQVEDVVVNGYRDLHMAGVDLQRQAVRLTEIRTSDSIGQQPDYNIADSLRRLPGVQTVFDEDEGRYVSIRGLNASYTLGQLDGAALATAERNNRQLNMESIPSTAVKVLEVIKLRTPDLDGNAIGGLINLRVRSPLEEPGPRAMTSFFTGMSDSTGAPGRGFGRPFDDGGNFRFDGAASNTFGDQDQFGVLISTNYSRRSRDQERLSTAHTMTSAMPSAAVAGAGVYYRAYPNTVDRYGGLIKLEARLDPALTARLTLSHFQQDDNELRLGQHFLGQRASQVQFNRFRIEKPLTTIQAAADWRSWTGHRLSARVSWSRAVFYEASPEVLFQLSGSPAAFDISVRQGVSYISGADPRLFAPAQYVFARHSPYVDDSVETVRELQIDHGVNRDPDARGWGFQSGLKSRTLTRDSDRTQTIHNGYGPGSLSLAGFVSPVVYRPLHGAFDQIVIDYDAFLRFFIASPSAFRLDVAQTRINSIGQDYRVQETVEAGYALAQHRSDRHVLVFGGRWERTRTEAEFMRQTGSGAGQQDFVPVDARVAYEDFLPSAAFSYDLNANLKLRLGYAEGVGRPNPGDLGSAETTAEDGSLNRSNPTLRTRRGRTYDASLEYYFPDRQGLLGASVFQKLIDGEIYRYASREVIDGVPVIVNRPRNATSAAIDGFELSLVRRSLPYLTDLGLSANVSWLNGRATVVTPGGVVRRLGALPQQSEWLANVALMYEHGPLEAHLSYAFVGDARTVVGETPSLDQVQLASHQLDAQFRFNLNNGVRLTAEVRNVTDQDKQTVTGPDGATLRDHSIYGRQLWIGVAFRY